MLRPLPDNTQHSQEKRIHDSGGIRNHTPSKRVASYRATTGIGTIWLQHMHCYLWKFCLHVYGEYSDRQHEIPYRVSVLLQNYGRHSCRLQTVSLVSFRVIHGRLLCVRRFLWLIQTFKDPVLGFKQNQLLNKQVEGEVYWFCVVCLIQQTPYRLAWPITVYKPLWICTPVIIAILYVDE